MMARGKSREIEVVARFEGRAVRAREVPFDKLRAGSHPAGKTRDFGMTPRRNVEDFQELSPYRNRLTWQRRTWPKIPLTRIN
jgi:hypothetical protein